MTADEAARRVAYLEGRVAGLEEALEERSELLRSLQRHLDAEGLLLLARLAAGKPPLPRQAYSLDRWRETTDLTPAEVDTTLTDLWRSLDPT